LVIDVVDSFLSILCSCVVYCLKIIGLGLLVNMLPLMNEWPLCTESLWNCMWKVGCILWNWI